MPALRERVKVDGDCLDVRGYGTDPGAPGDHGTSAGACRARAAVRGDAARRCADQPDQERPATRPSCEVRVMSHTGDYSRQVVKPDRGRSAGGDATIRLAPRQPAARGRDRGCAAAARLARHTPRAAVPRPRPASSCNSTAIPARSIDLSTVGAQVISPTVLRPNQKVRITCPATTSCMRFRGAIAWAKFELPQAAGDRAAVPRRRRVHRRRSRRHRQGSATATTTRQA